MPSKYIFIAGGALAILAVFGIGIIRHSEPTPTHTALSSPQPTKSLTAKTPAYTESQAPSPAIPSSQPDTQNYIDQAAVQAQSGNYTAAIKILNEAILLYPKDQNLELDKEYYQDKANASTK